MMMVIKYELQQALQKSHRCSVRESTLVPFSTLYKCKSRKDLQIVMQRKNRNNPASLKVVRKNKKNGSEGTQYQSLLTTGQRLVFISSKEERKKGT